RRERRLPEMAWRSDARTARRRRTRTADRSNRVVVDALVRSSRRWPSERIVWNARRRLDDRSAAAHSDGFADVVRHAPPQSVRLALVRARLAANHRHLP